MLNKRGQIFLIAAIVIIGIIVGLVTVVNIVKVGNENKGFYDLADEVGFETKQVLDYGVYNSQDTNALIEEFLIKYADYISQERVLFIFGNETNITGLFFNQSVIGSVGINAGGVSNEIIIQDITEETAEVLFDDGEVTVIINGIPYIFKLKPGQNFFFVIIKDENEESFVAAQ